MVCDIVRWYENRRTVNWIMWPKLPSRSVTDSCAIFLLLVSQMNFSFYFSYTHKFYTHEHISTYMHTWVSKCVAFNHVFVPSAFVLSTLSLNVYFTHFFKSQLCPQLKYILSAKLFAVFGMVMPATNSTVCRDLSRQVCSIWRNLSCTVSKADWSV